MEKNQPTNKTQLQEFAELIEQIPHDFLKEALKSSEDEDHKSIINAYAPSLTNQFKEISLHLNELATNAPRQRLMEAEKFLRMSSGVPLVQNLKLSLPSMSSILGKLGIKGIIQEIKKIIKFLLEIFNINLPLWVDKLLLLINQIIDHILGGSSIKTMTALSQKEQNYLSELTHFAKLQKATKDSGSDEDRED